MELVVDQGVWVDLLPDRVSRPPSRTRLPAAQTIENEDHATATAVTSDEALMARYQRGDDEAFGQLYARHRASLARFVRRISPDVGESEEILQETWMAVVRCHEAYVPTAKFSTYLFSIARRRTMDRWRQRGRSPETESDTEDSESFAAPRMAEPDQRAHSAALGDAIIAAVASLPLLQREAFLLRAEGDLSLEDIALATGTNRETAKSRLRYATRRLREILEPWA